MKRLILLLGLVISNCNLVLGDLSEEDARRACILVEAFYGQILGAKLAEGGHKQVLVSRNPDCNLFQRFRKACIKNKLEGKEKEVFLLNGRKTSLNKELETLIRLELFLKKIPERVPYDEFIEKAFECEISVLQALLEKEWPIKHDVVHILMFAALKNKGNIVNFLLDFLPKKKLTIDSRDNYGQLPLVMLAAEDNLPMVEFLLEKNANINSTNSRNFTAVMGAAELGHLDVIKSLIERGAEMELKNDKGATALALATESGHGAIVEYLAAKGADINALDSDGRTPLMIAILKDHTDIAEFLLRQENCTIDVKDNWGWTALELAAECGHQKIVELLLNKEADVNSQDADGYTPLMYAILKNHTDVVKYLLRPELKCGIDIQSNNGWTALLFAAGCGSLEIVKLLVEANADVNLSAQKGCTPIKAAICYNQTAVLDFLLSSPKIVLDESVFVCAISENKPGVVKLLLDKEVEADIFTIALATYLGHIEIVRLLIDRVNISEVYLPRTLNMITSRDSILLLLERGMLIENIPSELIDDSILSKYLTLRPDDFSKTEDFGKDLDKIKFFFLEHWSKFPKGHCEKFFNYFLKYLTKRQKAELAGFYKKLFEGMEPAPTPTYPEIDPHQFDLSEKLELETLLPTTTQMRKSKGKQPIPCSPLTPSKDNPSDRISKKPFEIVFDFTPGIASKKLPFSKVEKYMKTLRESCEVLRNLGVEFRINDKTEYVLSLVKLEGWGREFYDMHTYPNSVAKPHGSNKICTDHLNQMISYLVHYMCLAVQRRDEGDVYLLEKTEEVDRCIEILRRFDEASSLKKEEILKIYPVLEQYLR